MKKTLLAGLFALMGMFASAEVRINVTQSIRYGNGSFSTMDTPQISREKALKEGGKVYLRYDFEVNRPRGFWDAGTDDVYIAIRLLHGISDAPKHVFEITALSGAKDARLDVLNSCKEYDFYSALNNSIGRFPEANTFWFINLEKGSSSELIDDFEGILLKMPCKHGQKASLEFYIDYARLESLCESLHHRDPALGWVQDLLSTDAIPIDITFHPVVGSRYNVPNEEYRSQYGWNLFWIGITSSLLASDWKKIFSNSNRSLTLMVTE
ncbi:MAG: hypothetical protein II835_08395 [Fibrobacter sp.]|nr:hypothetical protein [Fibrobacter sp.]